MRQVSTDRENKSALNLGLEELLGQAEAALPNHSALDQQPVESNEAAKQRASSALSNQKPASPPKGEYELLADSANWSEIITRSEKSSGAEARLWWARAQCEMASMPLSIIAAPLEQSLREVSSSNPSAALTELATEVAGKISQALIDRKEFNLATALLEAGRKITPRLDAKFRSAAALELQQLNALPTRELDKHRLARKTYLLGFVSEMQRQHDVPNAVIPANSAIKSAPQQRSSLARRIFLGVIVATFLTLAGLYGLGAFGSSSVSPQAGILATTNTRPDVAPPSIKQAALQRASATSLLEAVLIEDQQRRGGERLDSASADSGLIINDKPSVQPSVSAPPVLAQLPAQPAPKEKINTTSPLEPREIREAGSRDRNRNNRSDRADELFEKPQDRRDSGSSLNGDAQRYRVLVRTEVHSIPSFSSSVLQRLERGDPVAVEEREGQWFRIRGRNGKYGYIAAQDVEPE